MKPTSLFLSVLLLLAGGSELGRAQKSSPREADQTPKLQADVREVLVPVVVTDKKGHSVSDLKASDFALKEDGIPQKIVALTTNGASSSALASETDTGAIRRSAEGGVAQSNGAPKRRTYWICVDTLHSSFTNFNHVRDALEKYFQQETSADSQYVLLTIGRNLNVIQDSTSDAALIRRAIRSERLARVIIESEASNTAADAKQFTDAVWQYCDSCGSCSMASKGNPAWCPSRTRQVQMLISQFEQRWLLVNQEFLTQLKTVASQLAAMPPSRTMIFVSDGFNRVPGRELRAILQGFGARDRDFFFNSQNTGSELGALLKVAVASDIRFYTLDSRGLYTQADMTVSSADASRGGINPPPGLESQASTVAHENTDALAEMAHRTGGLFFENNNDLLKGISRAFADGRAYYVLSYVRGSSTLSRGQSPRLEPARSSSG